MNERLVVSSKGVVHEEQAMQKMSPHFLQCCNVFC